MTLILLLLTPLGLINYFNQSTGILPAIVEGFMNLIVAPIVRLFS